MATSNDTRVRVDGFSKIITSTSSSMPWTQLCRYALARLLHGVGGIDDAAQGLGVDLVEIQEMSNSGCFGHGAWASSRLRVEV